jgi:hypothetical protein
MSGFDALQSREINKRIAGIVPLAAAAGNRVNYVVIVDKTSSKASLLFTHSSVCSD